MNRDREVGGELQVQGRRTSWAGSTVRVIDRDRQRLGMNMVHKAYCRIAVRVVEAMWRAQRRD